jgi:hypothetical protein
MKAPYRVVKPDGGRAVKEHRWLMEQHIGRPLGPDEHIHHINGDGLDNRIENLMIVDVTSHNRLHLAHLRVPKLCVNCGVEFVPWQRQHKRQKCCSPKCAQAMRLAARDYSR